MSKTIIIPGIYQVFFAKVLNFYIFNPHRVEANILFPVLLFWGSGNSRGRKLLMLIAYPYQKFTFSGFSDF